jgi:hypothetical protein
VLFLEIVVAVRVREHGLLNLPLNILNKDWPAGQPQGT